MINMVYVTVMILDPITFVLNAIVVAFGRSKWIICISAAAIAVLRETLLVQMSLIGRHWGDTLVAGFFAGLVQAAFAYWLISLWRNRSKREMAEQSGSSVER